VTEQSSSRRRSERAIAAWMSRFSQIVRASGPVGRRASNFALQKADLLLISGAGMAVSIIGFNVESLALRVRKGSE
jgi:hypothetical protein